MIFKDRIDAGRHLAERLRPEYAGRDAVILAIPRGGVVVGYEVARALNLPLDVVVPRKIGAPGNPELAIGAVAKDAIMINELLVAELGVPRSYIETEVENQRREIDRRYNLYLGGREPLPLEGRIAVIVDDGLATGFTAMAAVEAVKLKNPAKTILAVPVAPTEAFNRLQRRVDEFICLNVEDIFFAVGQFYERFNQTTDSEVIDILRSYNEEA